jgi:hypothetical protein
MASAPAMMAAAIALFAFIRKPLKRLFVFDGVIGYPAFNRPKRNRPTTGLLGFGYSFWDKSTWAFRSFSMIAAQLGCHKRPIRTAPKCFAESRTWLS